MTDRRAADTDRLYALLGDLAARLGGTRHLPTTTSGLPSHGVYFFFEPAETRADGSPRVVRVGTHALTAASRATLRGRLAQHRGNIGGRFPGGGNHRGSIFRRHIGTALLASGNWDPAVAAAWTAHRAGAAARAVEYPLERAVSARLVAMPLLWLPVPAAADRGRVERNSIALLSHRTGGIDSPSPQWLGRHAAAERVRTSGLWNVNHVDEAYDPAYLDLFAQLVDSTPTLADRPTPAFE
ncbi:hypothetical protein [Actinoplanes regularis]|uniref:hypothetical protein n=1 Tax=Actinoplanes regularis TaxID=52697 RepID=UPI0024A0DE9F|nr:hypothetical protein [Actinoplanes regularis]GLW31976.1 hypothetical protein Areg01_49150 [Actinoplanes regularis]